MTVPATSPRDGLGSRTLLVVLAVLSLLALVARLYAARIVGFGDSEALYAAYALHPAPAYLDHPGLIALLAYAIGDGAAPSPEEAHLVTTALSTLAPWVMTLAARALGATPRRALLAGVVTLAAPEVAVGLFGMTPDLPLFFAWTLALAAVGRALTRTPGSVAAAALFASAGLALGVACASKISGLTLVLACGLSLGSAQGREHARTIWPWVSLALCASIFAPVVTYETAHRWPMLHHRLVETQHDAGVSLRNAGGIFFGQAAYLSPLLFAGALALARSLYRARRRDAVRTLLASATFVPMIVLGPLCLWSRVAEPHWLAPAWLALPLYFACEPDDAPAPVFPGPRFRVAAVASGLVMSAVAYTWVLVPGLVALIPAGRYDPRLDIANELFGWPEVVADVERVAEDVRAPLGEPMDVVVAGPVWMVCAQLRDGLPRALHVGCAGTDVADFEQWAPRAIWKRADLVIFVHDNRAPADSAALFPERTLVHSHTHTVTRGGRVARVFTIEVLARRAAA